MIETNIANELREALLDTMKEVGLDLLAKSTEAIQKALKCTEVSLWTINLNDTQVNGKRRPTGESLSTSLISRTLHPDCHFIFENKEDFTHDLNSDCFFKTVLENKKPYRRTNKEGALSDKYKSERFIKEADINDVIAILITDKDSKYKESEDTGTKNIAILEISYSKNILNQDDWDILAPILHDFYSAAFKRYTLIQQQFLLNDLISLQDKHKDGTVEDMFKDVIDIICTTYCPCQGASFFMWDSFDEHYNLIYTTGLVDPVSNEQISENIYYMKGEGLTGYTGKYGKLFISDDLSMEKSTIHISKTCEIVKGDESIKSEKHSKTGMFIPIVYPKRANDVVGILRLINKKNMCNKKFVDYFNYKINGGAMKMASKYLSLICDFYIKQDEQEVFISKMTHELNTPANAIYKSSDLLYDNIADDEFLKRYLKTFLEDIRDLAQMQIWQVSTNMQLSKRRKQLPFNIRYNLQEYNLLTLFQDSRDIAIPIARKYKVTFNNIHIDSGLKCFRMKVDRNAFITVFYNLFTNAIKYHDKKHEFYINITGRISKDKNKNESLRLIIEDHGIGIDPKERFSIFEIGYRGKNAIEQNAHGYGIGLHVIKDIIEDFGGTIHISSFKKPTIFIINFPKTILV